SSFARSSKFLSPRCDAPSYRSAIEGEHRIFPSNDSCSSLLISVCYPLIFVLSIIFVGLPSPYSHLSVLSLSLSLSLLPSLSSLSSLSRLCLSWHPSASPGRARTPKVVLL